MRRERGRDNGQTGDGGGYQVLEERRQLFAENGKLEESGAHGGVLPAYAVVAQLLHGRYVLVLVLHVDCNASNTHMHVLNAHCEKSSIGGPDRLMLGQLHP